MVTSTKHGKSGKTRAVSFRLSNEDYALIERYMFMQGEQARFYQDSSVGEYCKRVIVRWIHRKH